MKNRVESLLFAFILSITVGLLAVFALALIWDVFGQENTREVFRILSDSFFFVGFMYASVGTLVIITSTGLFDMLGYGFKSLVQMFVARKGNDGYEKYYEYVERRRELRAARKKKTVRYVMIIVGIAFIIIAVIFMLLFYKYYYYLKEGIS